MESNRDPRVDRYIDDAAEFARPILSELRSRVHAACPEIQESIKWSMPFFVMDNRPVCMMAAFKQHCAFRFWHRGMKSVLARGGVKSDGGMSSFGRIMQVRDLPSKREFGRYVKEAAKLTATKTPARSRAKKVQHELAVPQDLADALGRNAAAAKTFERFSYTHRKEYVEWITTAKRPETRTRRLASTLEWLAAGKPQNWKYGA